MDKQYYILYDLVMVAFQLDGEAQASGVSREFE
jgi:hypothetical protein